MTKYAKPAYFRLKDLPEFQRFQQVNPGKTLDEKQAALMYGQAIHWLSFLDIIWPDFEGKDYYSIEVKYIVVNDPDRLKLPMDFYNQIAAMLTMFWRIRLSDLYPDGSWEVEISDDPEITVAATIHNRYP